MLETLRGEGVPAPACRAVVHAALRYVDAELLNALMLRRDCCSISAVKVLQVRKSSPIPRPLALKAGVCMHNIDPFFIVMHQEQLLKVLMLRLCLCCSDSSGVRAASHTSARPGALQQAGQADMQCRVRAT